MFQKLFKMYCKIIHYSSPHYATPTIAGKKKFLRFEDWIFLTFFFFFFTVGSIKSKQSLAFQLWVCQSASESHKHKKNQLFPQLFWKFPSLSSLRGLIVTKGSVEQRQWRLCSYSLPKPGFFFAEGRASFWKYSHSMKMSHAKIQPLIAFEGKGLTCVFFGGVLGIIKAISAG